MQSCIACEARRIAANIANAGAIAVSSLPRGQLRKDQAQDYRDYKQRKEISLPGRPERAFGALTGK
jgi:hypothetical protein